MVVVVFFSDSNFISYLHSWISLDIHIVIIITQYYEKERKKEE